MDVRVEISVLRTVRPGQGKSKQGKRNVACKGGKRKKKKKTLHFKLFVMCILHLWNQAMPSVNIIIAVRGYEKTSSVPTAVLFF